MPAITTLFTIEDFETEVRGLKLSVNSDTYSVLEGAVREYKNATKEIKELKEKNNDLEGKIEDLGEQIEGFQLSEDSASATLAKYADHNNWKDGNVWNPVDLTIDKSYGDELASKALNRSF